MQFSVAKFPDKSLSGAHRRNRAQPIARLQRAKNHKGPDTQQLQQRPQGFMCRIGMCNRLLRLFPASGLQQCFRSNFSENTGTVTTAQKVPK